MDFFVCWISLSEEKMIAERKKVFEIIFEPRKQGGTRGINIGAAASRWNKAFSPCVYERLSRCWGSKKILTLP